MAADTKSGRIDNDRPKVATNRITFGSSSTSNKGKYSTAVYSEEAAGVTSQKEYTTLDPEDDPLMLFPQRQDHDGEVTYPQLVLANHFSKINQMDGPTTGLFIRCL